jgi:hypothetical protein
MMYRALPLFLAALALLVGTAVLAAEDKAVQQGDTHEGTVVSVTADKLVMKGTAKDGEEAKEHTHMLADDAKVMCDGKACKLTDLKKGQKIRVTTKKGDKGIAIKVEALDKDEKFEKLDGKNDTEKKDKN